MYVSIALPRVVRWSRSLRLRESSSLFELVLKQAWNRSWQNDDGASGSAAGDRDITARVAAARRCIGTEVTARELNQSAAFRTCEGSRYSSRRTRIGPLDIGMASRVDAQSTNCWVSWR
jgi:hypothetical protein